MIFRRPSTILFFLIILLLLSSCSKFQRLLKSSDFNLKYEKAIEYYDDKDYYRSVSLLEELVSVFRGTDKAEKVNYYLAWCYYQQGDFILAGYHFSNFANTYPNSIHTEECSYMACYCYYLNSPQPSLDQAYTEKAINELQLFVEQYPNSTRMKECNELIDKLRDKLEDKSFASARLYFDLSDYKAATTTLKNTLKDFPDTKYREDILFLILKSSYLLAENSIEKKKKERYLLTVDDFYAFKAAFPESIYLKEAERIFDDATKNLK